MTEITSKKDIGNKYYKKKIELDITSSASQDAGSQMIGACSPLQASLLLLTSCCLTISFDVVTKMFTKVET
jgi:hypothetical protein